MNLILGISKETKWKVEVGLLEVTLMSFIRRRSKDIEMAGESGFTRTIIGELHSCDMQRYQMEGESGVTRSIIDELHSWYIQGHQIEGESGVTLSIINQLPSWDIQ